MSFFSDLVAKITAQQVADEQSPWWGEYQTLKGQLWATHDYQGYSNAINQLAVKYGLNTDPNNPLGQLAGSDIAQDQAGQHGPSGTIGSAVGSIGNFAQGFIDNPVAALAATTGFGVGGAFGANEASRLAGGPSVSAQDALLADAAGLSLGAGIAGSGIADAGLSGAAGGTGAATGTAAAAGGGLEMTPELQAALSAGGVEGTIGSAADVGAGLDALAVPAAAGTGLGALASGAGSAVAQALGGGGSAAAGGSANQGNNMTGASTGSSLLTALPAILAAYNYFDTTQSAKDNRNAVLSSLQGSVNSLSQLTPPDLASLVQPFQQAVFLGQLTPQQYVASVSQQSQLNGITVDPSVIQAQADALGKLKDIADQGGLTAQDRAQLNDIATQQATIARGAREAATTSAATRGLAGSGIEQLQRNQADQAAVGAASKRGTDVASLAQQRVLQAIQAAGSLGNTMQNTQFNEAAQKAAAQDAINKFNAAATQQAQAATASAQNQAAQQARAEQYGVQAQNLQQANLEQQQRLAASQQQYQDLYNQQKAKADVGTTSANTYANLYGADQKVKQAAATGLGQVLGSSGVQGALGGIAGGIGSAIGSAAGGIGSAIGSGINSAATGLGDIFGSGAGTTTADAGTGVQDFLNNTDFTDLSGVGDLFSDRNLKKDVNELSDDDMKGIMDSLVPSKYSYKNPAHGTGPRIGVMANDLVGTPGEGLVKQAPDGLALDGKKLHGFALAGLASLHGRVKKLENK